MCELCHTYLGVPVPVGAGIAEIACLLSLHMFPLFAPGQGGPSAAAGCSTHPKNDQNSVSYWSHMFTQDLCQQISV